MPKILTVEDFDFKGKTVLVRLTLTPVSGSSMPGKDTVQRIANPSFTRVSPIHNWKISLGSPVLQKTAKVF